jgi:hypothetical protein
MIIKKETRVCDLCLKEVPPHGGNWFWTFLWKYVRTMKQEDAVLCHSCSKKVEALIEELREGRIP